MDSPVGRICLGTIVLVSVASSIFQIILLVRDGRAAKREQKWREQMRKQR